MEKCLVCFLQHTQILINMLPPHHKDGGEDDSMAVRAEDDSTERVEDELDGLHSASPYIVSPVNK